MMCKFLENTISKLSVAKIVKIVISDKMNAIFDYSQMLVTCENITIQTTYLHCLYLGHNEVSSESLKFFFDFEAY